MGAKMESVDRAASVDAAGGSYPALLWCCVPFCSVVLWYLPGFETVPDGVGITLIFFS